MLDGETLCAAGENKKASPCEGVENFSKGIDIMMQCVI